MADTSEAHHLIVVGGGLAGLFGAISARESGWPHAITVLEREPRAMSGFLAMNDGEGIVTREPLDGPDELAAQFPRGGRELLGPFYHWGPSETVSWLEANSLSLETLPDGSIRPAIESRNAFGVTGAESVVDLLLKKADRVGIRLCLNQEVIHADKAPRGNPRFWITLADESTLQCARLLIATGGLIGTRLKTLLLSLGHTLEEPLPTLFNLQTRDERLRGCAGTSIEHATVRIQGLEETACQGSLEIFPWGIGGSATSRLSVRSVALLHKVRHRFVCEINLLGSATHADAQQVFERLRKQQSRRSLWGDPPFPIPQKLWEHIAHALSIPESVSWGTLSREAARALAQSLVRFELEIVRRRLDRRERSTCGGVLLDEVDFRGMQSRKAAGLFFAGQTLHFDGYSGFNLQADWTTARIAGAGIASSLKE